MYAKSYMDKVTKETVQSEIYLMVKSRAYYSFFIIKCKKCGKSVISLHVEHLGNGDMMAYFFCPHCGKKTKKIAFVSGYNRDEPAHYAIKHVGADCVIYKGETTKSLKHNEEYRGLYINQKKFLIVLDDKNIMLRMDEVKIIDWRESKYQPRKLTK